MIFFPAIDVKDGQCVRLERGDMARVTVFSDDPAGQARAFAAQGCRWLHVVDLDGAVAGRPLNADAVSAILAAVDGLGVRVQLGGGIRDLAAVERWLVAGVGRVVLGTVALDDPPLVAEACRRHPGRVAVAIDARDGLVAADGWTRTSGTTAQELARRLDGLGVAAIVHTDIERDGALGGPNVAATRAMAEAVAAPVIASGGVASMADLGALAAAGVIAGVICGRALYDGRIDVAAAVALLEEAG